LTLYAASSGVDEVIRREQFLHERPKTFDLAAAKDEDSMDQAHAHEHPHQQPPQAHEHPAAGMAGAMHAHAGHGEHAAMVADFRRRFWPCLALRCQSRNRSLDQSQKWVLRAPAINDTGDSEFSGSPVPFRGDRVLRVRDLNLWRTAAGLPNWASDAYQVHWSIAVARQCNTFATRST
jgi:hypothetical protein